MSQGNHGNYFSPPSHTHSCSESVCTGSSCSPTLSFSRFLLLVCACACARNKKKRKSQQRKSCTLRNRSTSRRACFRDRIKPAIFLSLLSFGGEKCRRAMNDLCGLAVCKHHWMRRMVAIFFPMDESYSHQTAACVRACFVSARLDWFTGKAKETKLICSR